MIDDRPVTLERPWAQLRLRGVLQPVLQELADGLTRRAHRQAQFCGALQLLELLPGIGLGLGVDLLTAAIL